MGRTRSLCAFMLLAALVPATVSAKGLRFSEYIEGTGNNKGLEIHNGLNMPVSLAGCSIAIYLNGSATPSATIPLPAVSLAGGDLFIVANNTATFAGSADLVSASLNFNGDDAVALLGPGGAFIDVIGQVGVDPGTEWLVGGVGTADETLRRKLSFGDGDANGSDVFSPNAQWDTFPLDDASNLDVPIGPCTVTVPGASAPASLLLSVLLGAAGMFAMRRRFYSSRSSC
jgi:predicted extracellular nuclease